MGEPRANAPIIIKKSKKIIAGGHHGGAWKVAYADFVTAMMAFFMLMWLLNATTEKQRKGIADYFNPTIPVNRVSGGGEGVFGGQSVFSEDALPQNGTGGNDRSPSTERQARGNTGIERSDAAQNSSGEDKAFRDIQSQLDGNSGESTVADELLEHIHTKVTDEGLIIEIFELPGEPLFRGAGAEPTKLLRQLTDMIARLVGHTRNKIAVSGYTRAYPVVLLSNPSWDLSTAQAHAVRSLLEKDGLSAARFQRVAGWADRVPVENNPMSARNNRLEVILLRSDKAATGNSRSN